MSVRKHALWRGMAVFAGVGSLLVTTAFTAGVASAAEEEEAGNNLSIPTLYIGSVGVGSGRFICGDHLTRSGVGQRAGRPVRGR